jgi:hypothetical protein
MIQKDFEGNDVFYVCDHCGRKLSIRELEARLEERKED